MYNMITLNLPELEAMEKIRVRLNELRQIVFKDNRKPNPSQKTIIPLDLKNHFERQGVYIIQKNDKVGYVGATTNLHKRMLSHVYLKRNQEIKFIYFLEENSRSKRFLYEMIYKFHYFGKVGAEWNYAN